MASTVMPSGTVRRYHGRLFSCGSTRLSFGVSEYTSPTSSAAGFGVVNSETTTLTMMSARKPTEDERREQRSVEEPEEGLEVVHDVGEAGRQERGPNRNDSGDDRGDSANLDVVDVSLVLDDVVLPDVHAEDGVKRRDVRGHTGHERRQQARDRDTRQAGRQQVANEEQHRVVVLDDVARRATGNLLARLHPSDLRHEHRSQHAWQHGEERHQHLRESADDRSLARRRQRVGRHGALHLDEVRRPVAEGQHESEAQGDADDRHHRVGESRQRLARPGMQLLGSRGHGVRMGLRCGGDLGLESIPSADAVQTNDDQRQQGGDDDEELQHLVVNGCRQATKADVSKYDHRSNDEGNPQRPSQ